MKSSSGSISPSEWEVLQRDCHPFPAYVDYIHGRPTEHERIYQPPMTLGYRGVNAHRAMGPPPNQAYPAAGFLASFSCMGPPEPPSAPPPTPPSQFRGMLPQEASPPVHILLRDDLLKPQYDWLTDKDRVKFNARVTQLRTIAENKYSPPMHSTAAINELKLISSNVASWAQERQNFDHMMHNVMPKVYTALQVRLRMPDSEEAIVAGRYLLGIQQKFEGPKFSYITRVLADMNENRRQGISPYEAIPGWREAQAASRQMMPQRTVAQGLMQNGTMQQGMMPQGMMPQGMTQQGIMAQGTGQQGMMPQGTMPHGAMPQGMMPHGRMMPYGATQHGMMPPGTMHPSMIPQFMVQRQMMAQGRMTPQPPAQQHAMQQGMMPPGTTQQRMFYQGRMMPQGTMPAGEVEQSKGETSPLPEWKRY